MSRLWLRVDTSLPRHPKVRRLAEMYGVPPAVVVGFLFAWWGYCAEFGSDGHPADCPRTVLTEFASDMVKLSALAVVPDVTDALREVRLMDRSGHPWDWQDWTGQLLRRRADDADRKRTVRKMSAPRVVVEKSNKDASSSARENLRVEPPSNTDWLRSVATHYAELDVLIMHLPSEYHEGLAGVVRAAKVPQERVSHIRALGPGGAHQVRGVTWDVVGRALRDCLAGDGYTPRRLEVFVSDLVRRAATGDTSRPATRQDRAFEVIENTPLPESA